ncbi:hypothetical protein QBC41DRAFT_280530 [Cercophora samala]|uniref:Uncharacterized protein n=1 Tax=Cercophora samala TaxID=330535 RepID=A0AA39ZAG9_9PEZI|nr:hypothetical protein QBC41DRAFT_280530 [Cercophora samala]
MAEVFGIVAGVVGLADVGTRLSLRLRETVRTWSNAPLEVLALNNEISDLTAVLRFTEDACRGAKHTHMSESFTMTLEQQLRTARQFLERIEDIIVLLSSVTGAKQKKRWIQLKATVARQKEELRAVRLKIWDLLHVHQVFAGARMQLELSSGIRAMSNDICTMNRIMETLNSNQAHMLESSVKSLAATQRLEQAVPEILSLSRNPNGNPFMPLLLGPSPSQAIEVSEAAKAKDQGTFSIWTVYRHRTCLSGCVCACHKGKRSSNGTIRSPVVLQRLIGALFAVYTGSPGSSGVTACDTPMCHRQASKTFEMTYEFPLWFARWSMHALIYQASLGVPSVSLVIRKRVEYRFDSIFAAVDSNNIDAVQAILQRDPDSINYKVHQNGFTPLHYACLRPNKISFRMFQLLLRAGADVNAENDGGRSALSYVAGFMVLGGFPSLHKHEISRWVSPSRMLDELELSPITEVAVGVRVGDIASMLQSLAPSRLRLDEFDNTGSTPLCWASKAGNLEAIKLIVETGTVDVNQCTSVGNTALMCSFALQNGQTGEIIDWLLDNGADPLQRNDDGYNAFTLACYLGRFDVVQQLIRRGVNPDVRDGQGRTGLFCAIPYDHDHIVRYLYEMGADVDAVNAWYFVPVLVATGYNAHRCLRMLLFEAKADHRFRAPSGWNLLLHAASCGNELTLKLLSEHGLAGLDIHTRGNGRTAEEEFFSRPATASEPIVAAFKELLFIVEQNKEGYQAQVIAEMEQDAEEVYFDALTDIR